MTLFGDRKDLLSNEVCSSFLVLLSQKFEREAETEQNMKNKKQQMIYQKENVFLMNFTFRKKYDYILYCHLQQIYQAHCLDRKCISRNKYIKEAVIKKMEREENGSFLEVPKRFLTPFPKQEKVKIQFTLSINRKTEAELYQKLQRLPAHNISVLDYIRDSVYEQILSENKEIYEEGIPATTESVTLVLQSRKDADILACLNEISSPEEREKFIKQSIRDAIKTRDLKN